MDYISLSRIFLLLRCVRHCFDQRFVTLYWTRAEVLNGCFNIYSLYRLELLLLYNCIIYWLTT